MTETQISSFIFLGSYAPLASMLEEVFNIFQPSIKKECLIKIYHSMYLKNKIIIILVKIF